jgi:hypothetical protein
VWKKIIARAWYLSDPALYLRIVDTVDHHYLDLDLDLEKIETVYITSSFKSGSGSWGYWKSEDNYS